MRISLLTSARRLAYNSTAVISVNATPTNIKWKQTIASLTTGYTFDPPPSALPRTKDTLNCKCMLNKQLQMQPLSGCVNDHYIDGFLRSSLQRPHRLAVLVV